MVRIEISSPSLQEAAKSGGPVEVVDSATGQTFILDDDADDPLLASYQQ